MLIRQFFYPEGGDKLSDNGCIEGIPVLDVKLIENEIYHKLENPLEKTRVKLMIDYNRRFDYAAAFWPTFIVSCLA
ncbi:hypothetical protein KHA80_18930 [Anaerobacillus sp. HL2]|nr:hypothetical protein KHA80_18930 [Anaerobacillus sp. HL2]